MSLAIAKAWVRSTLRHPAARIEANAMLERAHVEGVEATLVVGRNLSVKRRCYLARWTLQELIVLELSDALQTAMHVDPNGLMQQIHILRRDFTIDRPAWVELSGARINESEEGSTQISLIGNCEYELKRQDFQRLAASALRAEYFRPDLPRDLAAYWYPAAPLCLPKGKLSFEFPPLEGFSPSLEIHGPMILFLEMAVARSWQRLEGVERISNVLAIIVENRRRQPTSK